MAIYSALRYTISTVSAASADIFDGLYPLINFDDVLFG